MEQHYFNIKESDTEAVIEVYGTIGESWWDEGVTFQGVSDQLKDIAKGTKKVLVKINSYGGDVNDALAIFELLRSMGDRVTTECVGFCASAATIIAMAGKVRRMSSYGLFLVHKCWGGIVGNENELEAELEAQRKVNEAILKVYQDVTGTDKAKLEELMNRNNGNGEWLNVDEAMDYGFITEAIKDTKEDTAKKNFYRNMFMNLFNKNNSTPMKKDITTLGALVALLAVNEVEANKEGKVLMDEETLTKINDALLAKEQRADELQTNLEAAETAKAEAESAKAAAEEAKAEAETKKAELEAKVAELQAMVDKMPANEPPAGGSDTHQDQEESFAEWYSKQEYVKEAKAMLNR